MSFKAGKMFTFFALDENIMFTLCKWGVAVHELRLGNWGAPPRLVIHTLFRNLLWIWSNRQTHKSTTVTWISHSHNIDKKLSGSNLQYAMIFEKENLVGYHFLPNGMSLLDHICLVWIRHGFGVLVCHKNGYSSLFRRFIIPKCTPQVFGLTNPISFSD